MDNHPEQTATPHPDPETNSEQVPIVCRECGQTFSVSLPAGEAGRMVRRYLPVICGACAPTVEARVAAAELERERAEQTAKRQTEWEEQVAPLYRETVADKLPVESGPAMIAATAWNYGPKGLGFCGESRKGKTRVMYGLLHRLLIEHGRRFIAMTTAEFSHKVSRYAAEDVKELDSFLNRLCRVSLLFLDDVGKGRMTDRVEAEMYHVIETRTANLKPILFTSNLAGDSLIASMSADRGVPIIERLREFCDVVII